MGDYCQTCSRHRVGYVLSGIMDARCLKSIVTGWNSQLLPVVVPWGVVEVLVPYAAIKKENKSTVSIMGSSVESGMIEGCYISMHGSCILKPPESRWVLVVRSSFGTQLLLWAWNESLADQLKGITMCSQDMRAHISELSANSLFSKI